MAKRVNTRFLIILTSVVVLLGVSFGAVLVARSLRNTAPQLIASAKTLMEAGKHQEAEQELARAYKRSPGNADILVLMGQNREKMALTNAAEDNLRKTWSLYVQATEIDPTHVSALQNLVRMLREELAVAPNRKVQAELAGLLKTYSTKLAAADPGDVGAKVDQHAMVLRAVESGVPTDNREVDAAIDALKKLAAEHPQLVDPPAYVSRALLRKADEAVRERRSEDAQVLTRDALEVVDVAVKTNPDSAGHHYHAFRAYDRAGGIHPSKDYLGRSKQLAARASELAKPEDREYVDIRRTAPLAAGASRAELEAAYRELLAQRPSAHVVRRDLATLVRSDPGRIPEAIDLLTQPVPRDPAATPAQNRAGEGYAVDALLEATKLRIDLYAQQRETNPTANAQLLQIIEADIKRLTDKIGETGDTLAIAGFLQQAKGNTVEAVRTLTKAHAELQQKNRADPAVMYALARACINAGQTGQAMGLLEQLVQQWPNFAEARVTLGQQYLAGRRTDDAAAQLAELERQRPGFPDVQRMKLAIDLARGQRGGQVKGSYAQLPEDSAQAISLKAQTAMELCDDAETERLLEKAASQHVDQMPELAINLAQGYATRSKPDAARKVIDRALAVRPDHAALAMVAKRLDNASPEELYAYAVEALTKNPDAYERELSLGELEGTRRQYDKAATHFRAALQEKPNDPRALDQLFQIYLVSRQLDRAQELLDPLAQANADNAQGRLFKFKLALARRNIADALAIGSDLTATLPEFSQSWVAHGQALQLASRFDDAIDKYQRALERQHNHEHALRGLVDCYYAVAKPVEAERAIADARRLLPGHRDFIELELNHKLAYGNPEEVIPAREQALAQRPDDPANYAALAGAHQRAADLQAGTADAQDRRTRHLEQALNVSERALKRWPDELRFYTSYCDAALALDRPDDAERVLQSLLTSSTWKERHEPYALLGELHLRASNDAKAEEFLRQAIAKSGDGSATLRILLAKRLSERGRVDDAVALLPVADADPVVVRQRAEILGAAARHAEAEQAVRAALERTPLAPDLLAQLATAQLNQSKFEDALQTVEKVLTSDPQNPIALYVRAQTRLLQPSPNPEAAIADLLVVRGKVPSNMDVRIALADAYKLRNDPDGAIRELESALQVAPEHTGIRIKLLDAYLASSPPRMTSVDRLLQESQQIASLRGDSDWLAAASRASAAQGEGRRALDQLREAMAAAPGDARVARRYYTLLVDQREYDQLLRETRTMSERERAPWWVHQLRAAANVHLQDRDAAMADYEKALRSAEDAGEKAGAGLIIRDMAARIGADQALERVTIRAEADPRWWVLALYLQQAKGDQVAVESTLAMVMQKLETLPVPDQVQAMRFAGSHYMLAQPPRFQEAEKVYRRLLEHAPMDLLALNNLACLLAERVNPPRPQEALELSSKAYEHLQKLGRFDPVVYDTHGWLLVLNDRVGDGAGILRTVVERQPFIDALYHLGEAYLRQQPPYPQEAERQLKLADEHFRKALDAKQPVDAELKTRIDAAITRAQQLMAAPAAPAR